MVPHRAAALVGRNALLLAILALVAVFSLLNASFLTVGNLRALLEQNAPLAIIAVGTTFGIISRNIDISSASVAALATVFVAFVFVATGSILLGLACGLAATLAVYLANGLLVASLGLDPLIVTLAAWIWARGLAVSLTDAQTIAIASPFVRFMNDRSSLGVAPSVILAGLAFLLGWIILTKTRLGLYAYALGADERGLLQSGVSPGRTKVLLFCVMGLFTGLSVMAIVGRFGAAAPTAGFGLELDAVVAVILGGTSFRGGTGSMVATIAGVLFIAVLNNGLNLLQMEDSVFYLVKGTAILLALVLEWLSRHVLARPVGAG